MLACRFRCHEQLASVKRRHLHVTLSSTARNEQLSTGWLLQRINNFSASQSWSFFALPALSRSFQVYAISPGLHSLRVFFLQNNSVTLPALFHCLSTISPAVFHLFFHCFSSSVPPPFPTVSPALLHPLFPVFLQLFSTSFPLFLHLFSTAFRSVSPYVFTSFSVVSLAIFHFFHCFSSSFPLFPTVFPAVFHVAETFPQLVLFPALFQMTATETGDADVDRASAEVTSDDLFQMQHHHLLTCLEHTTVSLTFGLLDQELISYRYSSCSCCCCCWGTSAKKKPKAPSFLIESRWNLPRLFSK